MINYSCNIVLKLFKYIVSPELSAGLFIGDGTETSDLLLTMLVTGS